MIPFIHNFSCGGKYNKDENYSPCNFCGIINKMVENDALRWVYEGVKKKEDIPDVKPECPTVA